MKSVFISTTKLVAGKSYRSGLSGTIVPVTNKIQLNSAIKFQQRSNSHYERNQSLYFNYLDADNICVLVKKVV